jgi:predicted nucleic acid-binding protein
MILLDTTVLSYSVGDAHPLREPCRLILAAHADGRVVASTTLEVIQEFTHVRSRRRPRANAVALARAWLAGLYLIAIEPEDVDRGLTIFESTPRLGSFDCVTAAVALNRRAKALVSADRGFGDVPGLNWVVPSSQALQSLLG